MKIRFKYLYYFLFLALYFSYSCSKSVVDRINKIDSSAIEYFHCTIDGAPFNFESTDTISATLHEIGVLIPYITIAAKNGSRQIFLDFSVRGTPNFFRSMYISSLATYGSVFDELNPVDRNHPDTVYLLNVITGISGQYVTGHCSARLVKLNTTTPVYNIVFSFNARIE